jgi:hypothetical protein
MLLDTMPGCGALAGFAAEAAGNDDRYEGACDDEFAGAVAAWDRVEAYAAARKHAAVAEFIRRRPRPGSPLEGPAQLPESWDESIKQDPRWTVDQLPDGTFRWTTPTGRQYTTEPTRYPI